MRYEMSIACIAHTCRNVHDIHQPNLIQMVCILLTSIAGNEHIRVKIMNAVYSHQWTTYTNESLFYFLFLSRFFPVPPVSFTISLSLHLSAYATYYLLSSDRYCSHFYVSLFIWQTIHRNAIKDYTLWLMCNVH